MKKTSKIIICAAVALVAVAAVLFFLRPRGGAQVSLGSAKVERMFMSTSVTATGTVEPVTEVEVGTQVSGIVDKLYADYNDEVKAGQLLAEMDKITLQAEVNQANIELSSTKTEYEYQSKNYNRVKALHEKQLVSESDYDEAFYKYQTAKNAYEKCKASLVKVKRNLSYATITSPIDGVVISRAVEEGQTVAAGFETPTLYTIAADLTQMQVIADIDEADIGQVLEGQRVEFKVDAYPDDTFEGQVQQVRLEPTTTSNVVTYEVVITAYNPELKLKPGLTANVTIYTAEHEDAVAVPTKALRYTPDGQIAAGLGLTLKPLAEPAKKSVWLVEGASLVETAVSTGVVSGDMTEILEGLEGGETVATGITQAEPVPAADENSERSPFMPQGPGGKKK